VTLTPDEEIQLTRSRTIDPEAYEAYLKGQFHWYKLTPADVETALQYFELAREKDPDYALAHVGIALVWGGRGQMGLVPPREAGPKKMEAVLRALELDNTLAEAHYALATTKTWGEWDWEAAKNEYRRALELNPSYADLRAYYSHFLMIMKRPDEAIAQMERALELDPFNPLIQILSSVVLAYSFHQIDDAIERNRNVLRTVPNHQLALWILHVLYFEQGMLGDSLEAAKAQAAARGDSETVGALEHGFAEAGFRGAMSRAGEILAARSAKTYVWPFYVAMKFAMASENPRALDWLERAFNEGDGNMPYIGLDFSFDGLRDEPRFQELLRRMDFPEDVLARYLQEIQ